MINKVSVQTGQAACRKNFGRIRLRAPCRVSTAGNPKNVFPPGSLSGLYIYLFKYTFFLTIIIINISCASAPSADSRQEAVHSFSKIENFEPRWQLFADGIVSIHARIESPRLEFWAFRIDLSMPGLGVVVRGGGGSGGKNTLSAKVSSFVRDNNLIIGINAVPFDISSSREGQPIVNAGIVISGGELISPASPRYDALVFYMHEKRAAIIRQSTIRAVNNIENAVGGFHQILVNGEPAPRTRETGAPSAARHPRSAAGVSANGRFVYLLVIDGRRAGSAGSTELETALILGAIGSWDGLNLDGGGSSAVAIRSPDGKIKVLNTPVHRLPGQERAVAGCVGIRSGSR